MGQGGGAQGRWGSPNSLGGHGSHGLQAPEATCSKVVLVAAQVQGLQPRSHRAEGGKGGEGTVGQGGGGPGEQRGCGQLTTRDLAPRPGLSPEERPRERTGDEEGNPAPRQTWLPGARGIPRGGEDCKIPSQVGREWAAPEPPKVLGVSGTVWEVTHILYSGQPRLISLLLFTGRTSLLELVPRSHPVSGHCTGTSEAKPRTSRVTKMDENVHEFEASRVLALSGATG